MPQNLKRLRVQNKNGQFTHVWVRAESKKKAPKKHKQEQPHRQSKVDGGKTEEIKLKKPRQHKPQRTRIDYKARLKRMAIRRGDTPLEEDDEERTD